jgi:hypothetical protein
MRGGNVGIVCGGLFGLYHMDANNATKHGGYIVRPRFPIIDVMRITWLRVPAYADK